METCVIDGCDKPILIKKTGLCNRHRLQISLFGEIRDRTNRTMNEYIHEGDVTKIVYYNKKGDPTGHIIIDTADFEKCRNIKWCVCNGYPYNNDVGMLHNYLMDFTATRSLLVDHKDRKRLNCRRSNLRIVSHKQNAINHSKQKSNSSGYIGVCWQAKNSKWNAYISKDSKRYHLGYFDDPVEAAKAYNRKAIEMHGEFAVLNDLGGVPS
jgi:hypothetical protein